MIPKKIEKWEDLVAVYHALEEGGTLTAFEVLINLKDAFPEEDENVLGDYTSEVMAAWAFRGFECTCEAIIDEFKCQIIDAGGKWNPGTFAAQAFNENRDRILRDNPELAKEMGIDDVPPDPKSA